MVLNKLQKYHAEGYTIFRIILGLMFVQHGAEIVKGGSARGRSSC